MYQISVIHKRWDLHSSALLHVSWFVTNILGQWMSPNFKGHYIKEKWQKQVDQYIYRKTVMPAIGQQDIFWEDHTGGSKKMCKVISESRREDNRLRTGQQWSCTGEQTWNTGHAGNHSNNRCQNLHGLGPDRAATSLRCGEWQPHYKPVSTWMRGRKRR